MRSVEQKEVNLPLGIVVEKRKSKHLWADWIWKPVAVFIDRERAMDQPVELLGGEDFQHFHVGTLKLNLHRKDTEALRLNLMLPQPELYVVLRQDEDGNRDFPFRPFLVTASSYAAQDFTDAGDDIIEKVAMPDPVAAFIQAFVEQHHVEEVFKKRRRENLNTEEQKFGKAPIFETHMKR